MNNLVVRKVETLRELEDAQEVRCRVFIEEQGISREEELDGLDMSSEHIIAYADNVPVGTVRIRYKGGVKAKLERVAVLRSYRGRGIGREIVEASMGLARANGAAEAVLGAQQAAIRFYERLGFHQTGEPFEEAGIPHIALTREL